MQSGIVTILVLLCSLLDVVSASWAWRTYAFLLAGVVVLDCCLFNSSRNTEARTILHGLTVGAVFLCEFYAVDFSYGWRVVGPVVFFFVFRALFLDFAEEGKILVLLLLAVISSLIGIYQIYVDPFFLISGNVQFEQYYGRGSGHFSYPNALAALILLCAPLAYARLFTFSTPMLHRLAYGAVIFILGVALFGTSSRAGIVGFGLGLTAYFAFCYKGSDQRRNLILPTLVLVGVVGVAAVPEFFPKAASRLDALKGGKINDAREVIWGSAYSNILSEPWAGNRIGSFNYIFESRRPAGFNQVPMEIHNEYLQVAHDLGVPALVILVITLGLICFRRSKSEVSPDESRLAAMIGVGAFAVAVFFDFQLRFYTIACALSLIFPVSASRNMRVLSFLPVGLIKPLGIVVSLCLAGYLVFLAGPRLYAESLRLRAGQVLLKLDSSIATDSSQRIKSLLGEAQTSLTEAYSKDSRNLRLCQDLSLLFSQKSRIEPSRSSEYGQIAERYAKEALTIYPNSFETFIRLGVAADMQGDHSRSGGFFTTALKLAPNNAIAWYHYAYHLSLKQEYADLCSQALAVCLRLDPGYRPAIVLSASIVPKN